MALTFFKKDHIHYWRPFMRSNFKILMHGFYQSKKFYNAGNLYIVHSVYPSVCRTDGYGTDRRLQEHSLFRAKNVLYSFSSKTVRFKCIVISALHVHLLSSKTP